MANGIPRATVLALLVVAYVLAAWAVAPGFYDGWQPPQPYRWVSPPPQFRSSNQPPQEGSDSIRVNGTGVVGPGSIFTRDDQASIAFVQDAFLVPAGRAPVTLDIRPQPAFPDPDGVHLATNVYCITSSSPLAPGKDALVTLQYSDQLPAPSDVYEYQDSGPWQKIGSTGSAAPYFIAVRTTSLGCFAGGYPANAAGTAQGATVSGAQALPIILALAILVVVLAGIPLAVLRRRSEEEEGQEP